MHISKPYRCIHINCNAKCSKMVRITSDTVLLYFSTSNLIYWKTVHSYSRPLTSRCTFIPKYTNWIHCTWYLTNRGYSELFHKQYKQCFTSVWVWVLNLATSAIVSNPQYVYMTMCMHSRPCWTLHLHIIHTITFIRKI